MSKRSIILAGRIEQGASNFIEFITALTEAEWRTICQPDKRTVGVIAHHVASSYPAELQVVKLLAAGQALTNFTGETLDLINAEHAQANADARQEETIKLLRRNSREAANAVRELENEHLDGVATISLIANAPLTAQYFIEAHLIAHSYRHLNKLKVALGAVYINDF